MNRPNAITIASITAILFAGTACVSVYSYLQKQAGKNFQGLEIATAATDIPIGTKIDPRMVKLVKWPKESLPQGYCANAALLQGRVAVRPIVAGDIVTEGKLMPLNGGAGNSILSYIVPQGHRAVTVAVNEVAGVAGFITPQSRVDVVLTTPRPGAADREDNISKVILQNVSVLASGQVTEQKDGKPVITPTVTLDLVPTDAEKLIVGAKKGSLQLLLRNAIDVAAIDTKGATVVQALGRDERPSVPAPAPRKVIHVAKVKTVVKVQQAPQPQVKAAPPQPAGYQMEIIKGSARSKGEFAEEQ